MVFKPIFESGSLSTLKNFKVSKSFGLCAFYLSTLGTFIFNSLKSSKKLSINTSINAIFTFGVENCNRQQTDSHISLCIPSVAICGFGEVCEDKLTSLKNVTAKGWSSFGFWTFSCSGAIFLQYDTLTVPMIFETISINFCPLLH